MSSSRDSSVWRSLAVAFGDGLAFGVGMKLTQSAGGRPAGPAIGAGSAADRLTQLEERIRRIERAPVAAAPGPAMSGKIDQQVLEALVNAVETRLQEQAAATERRIADLEARMAVELKAVLDDVHAIATGAEVRIREVQEAARTGVETARNEVAELAAGRRNDAAAIASGLEKLGARVVALENRAGEESGSAQRQAAAAASKVDQMGRTLLEGYQTLRAQMADFDRKAAAIEERFTGALAAHAEQLSGAMAAGADRLREEIGDIEDRLRTVTGLLSTHEHKPAAEALTAQDQVRVEVAGLREKLENVQAGIERAVDTAVLAGIDGAERRLLEQVRESTEHATGLITRNTETAVRQKIAPLAAAVAELQAKSDESEAQAMAMMRSIGQAYLDASRRPAPRPEAPPPDNPPPAESEQALPEPKPANGAAGTEGTPMFGEVRKSGRVWRVPLVSSFVFGAAGLALLQLVR